MNSRDEVMAALSRKAGIDARAATMDQLRADFKFVFGRFRGIGDISKAELDEDYAVCGDGIRRNSHDPDWTQSAQAHFRQMAADMERDIARSERIKAERRAEKEQANEC